MSNPKALPVNMGKSLVPTGFSMTDTRVLKKLPMLSALPTSDDMRKIVKVASENIGQRVQTSWVTDQNKSYNLSCTIVHIEFDPEWSLTSGGIMSAETSLWTHTTGDTELLLNLALMESGAEKTVEQNLKSMTANAAPILSSQLESQLPNKVSGQHVNSAAHAAQLQPASSNANAPSGSLQGSLTDMPLASVLQSISMTKMTGRLSVDQDVESANIYFEDGVPVHAACLESDGDLALLELVSWDVGKFRFFNGERTTSRTVKKRLQNALIEGTVLLDQHKYLLGLGLQPHTYLHKANPSLSEIDFERILAQAAVPDTVMSKRFYISTNGSTLSELLIDMSVRKAEWVPALYNLLSNNLLRLSDKPALQTKASTLELIDIDLPTVARAYEAILRPETGALSFPLFMHFVQQEQFRFQRTSLPYALIIFELVVVIEGKAHQPNPSIQREILKIVNDTIRRTDLVGHFRTFEFGLVLPNTNTHGAIVIAKKLLAKLLATGVQGAPAGSLLAAMGLASLPADAPNLDMLLAASLDAKKIARQTGQPIVSFKANYS